MNKSSSTQRVLRNTYLVLLVLIGVMIIGVVGFYYIEDFTLMESFYMTVITISTVGFKEVRPLSPGGQLFTSFLIIGSFGTFAYGISVVTRSILNGELAEYFKLYRLEQTIQNLEGHVIIAGYGRNGRRAAQKLKAYGSDILVIENDEDIINQHLRGGNILFIEGDASEDRSLLDANIKTARAIICTLGKDSDNVYTVITARQLNPEIKVISRASTLSAEAKLRAIGTNHVVMPEGVGGAHMATLVMSPGIVEFLDSLSVEGSSAINLEEIEVSRLTNMTEGIKLKDLALRQKTGCTVIGLKTPDGDFVINPDADQRIEPNSRLFVLGKPEEIVGLNDYLHDA
jgi:voltage-gated potassium channel